MKLYISPSIQEGNVGPNGYVEETQMNLIADILIPELIRHGQTIMRNDRTESGVNAIVDESNAWGSDYHIAIHSNANNKTLRGCEVYCDNPADLTRKGTQMAHALYDQVTAIAPVKGRGVLSGHTTMSEVAHTTAPAALIEIDYHDTVGGADWIKANIYPIAIAILKGILKQIGVPYVPAKLVNFTLTDPTLKDDRVSVWQFVSNSFGSGLAVDRSYGPLCEAWQRSFEGENGLVVDGIVDFDDLIRLLDLYKEKMPKESYITLTLHNRKISELVAKNKAEVDGLKTQLAGLNGTVVSLREEIIQEQEMHSKDLEELTKSLASCRDELARKRALIYRLNDWLRRLRGPVK